MVSAVALPPLSVRCSFEGLETQKLTGSRLRIVFAGAPLCVWIPVLPSMSCRKYFPIAGCHSSSHPAPVRLTATQKLPRPHFFPFRSSWWPVTNFPPPSSFFDCGIRITLGQPFSAVHPATVSFFFFFLRALVRWLQFRRFPRL